MDSFSVGEVAIFVTGHCRTRYDGQECEIVDRNRVKEIRCPECNALRSAQRYLVRFSGDEKAYAAEPHNLRKKKPPATYDGSQVTTWDICPWQPRELA